MRAEIVAVGSELLLGEHVDTNSAWISARLAEAGVDVFRHTTVGDNPGRLAEALREALARADALVVTGGLGPTQDDLTRQAVAEVAGAPLERRAELVGYLERYFERGGRPMPISNLVQADLPRGARVLAPTGTAAGFALDVAGGVDGGGCTIYCLPGVPREMEAMMDAEVLPALIARAGLATTVSRLVRTSGMAEAAVSEALHKLVERLDESGNPTVAFLASRGETRVRLTAKAADRSSALALLAPVVDEVVELLGTAVVGLDAEGTEHAVARQLQRLGWTLGVAESVTGGNLGARLVEVPGASDWFRGGVLAYATDVKTSVVGVPADVLAAEGPVSERTSAALAERVRDLVAADVGIGVTGVAGPDTQGGQPVGTICLAVALPHGSTQSRTLRMGSRTRDQVQQWAATAALDFLRRRLAEVR